MKSMRWVGMGCLGQTQKAMVVMHSFGGIQGGFTKSARYLYISFFAMDRVGGCFDQYSTERDKI